MKQLAALAALAVGLLILEVLLQPPRPAIVRAEPASIADTAIARGRLVYERYGCVMCHGDDGSGGRENLNSESDGKVPGVIRVAEGYTKAELVRLVKNGIARIGREDPSGPTPPYRMPGWGDRLTDAQAGDLVDYLIGLAPESTSWQ